MIVTPNSPVLLSAQIAGRPTTAGVRARIFNLNSVEVSGSPFVLTHVNQGLYINKQWVPTQTGDYVARFEIYVDNTFAVIDPDRDWALEDITVLKHTGLSSEVDKGL